MKRKSIISLYSESSHGVEHAKRPKTDVSEVQAHIGEKGGASVHRIVPTPSLGDNLLASTSFQAGPSSSETLEHRKRISVRKRILKENQDADKLRGRLATARTEIRTWRKQVDELNKDLVILQAKLKAKRNKFREKIKNIKQKCNELNESRVKSSIEWNVDKRRCGLLQESNERLQKLFDDLSAASATNRSRCNTLQEKAQELQVELDGVQGELKEEKEKSLCSICYERQRNVLCMPCLHLICCIECAEQHLETSNTCPFCRLPVRGRLECYM